MTYSHALAVVGTVTLVTVLCLHTAAGQTEGHFTYLMEHSGIKSIAVDIPDGLVIVNTLEDNDVLGARFSLAVAASTRIISPFQTAQFSYDAATGAVVLNLTRAGVPTVSTAPASLRGAPHARTVPASATLPPGTVISAEVNVTLGAATVLADLDLDTRAGQGALVQGPTNAVAIIRDVNVACAGACVTNGGGGVFSGCIFGSVTSIGGSPGAQGLIASGIDLEGSGPDGNGEVDIYNITSFDLTTATLMPLTVSSTALLRSLGYSGLGQTFSGSQVDVSVSSSHGYLLLLDLLVACNHCNFVGGAGSKVELGFNASLVTIGDPPAGQTAPLAFTAGPTKLPAVAAAAAAAAAADGDTRVSRTERCIDSVLAGRAWVAAHVDIPGYTMPPVRVSIEAACGASARPDIAAGKLDAPSFNIASGGTLSVHQMEINSVDALRREDVSDMDAGAGGELARLAGVSS